MSAESTQSFTSLTGASSQVAARWLEMAGGDLQVAVSLYLDNGGSSAKDAVKPPAAPTLPGGLSMPDGVDAATAAAIQAAAAEGSPAVRAPIASKRQRLFDEGGMVLPPNVAMRSMSASAPNHPFRNFAAEARDLEARHTQRSRDARASKARPTANPANSATARDTEESRGRGITDLFAPPRSLLFPGGFDEARAHAREQRKWLMVNIQDDEEFISHCLNRDVWSHETVQPFVQQNFVFFQHERRSSAGMDYCRFYHTLGSLPHVGVLDPRTGELLMRIKVTGVGFELALRRHILEQIDRFLSENAFESGATSCAPAVTAAAAATTEPNGAAPRPNVGRLTEEEELAAAIAASLAECTTDGKVLESSAAGDVVDVEAQGTESGGVTTSVSATSSFAGSLPPLETEPTAKGDGVTTVQIRLLGGKCVRRRFMKAACVKQLFAFTLEQSPTPVDFDLVSSFPRMSLRDCLAKLAQSGDILSISKAGLHNAMLHQKEI